MGEFLKGWRRKTGLVTLVMACVFTGRWISGPGVLDTITIYARHGSLTQLISRDATIAVRMLKSALPIETIKGNADRFLVTTSAPDSRRPGKFATSIDEYTLSALGQPYKWIFAGLGFAIGSAQSETGLIQVSIWKAHYGSIVIPLTLLSAYLLLSKSRIATPKKTIELDRA